MTTIYRIGKIDGLNAHMMIRPDPAPDAVIVDDMICDLGGNLTPKLSRLLPTPFCKATAADWIDFYRYGMAWGAFRPIT